MAGMALFAISMWEFAPITHDWGARELLFPQALRGMAQQLAVPPVVTLTLGGLAPARLKLASGLFNLMRNLGGAIGIAACATILNDRTNLHFQRLAEHLNSTNESLALWMTSAAARLGTPADRPCCGRSGGHLPRGADPGVRGRVLGDHGRLHPDRSPGAAHAQSGAAQCAVC